MNNNNLRSFGELETDTVVDACSIAVAVEEFKQAAE